MLGIVNRLMLELHPAYFILAFFAFSLGGYILECIVLTIEKRKLVINRGFVKHLPFCIIYGFGAMIGYAVLRPFGQNIVVLYIVGALLATGFEYLVAKIQIALFDDFWWDYTEKPFNYKGILCLESTLGWGLVAVIIVRFLYKFVVLHVKMLPQDLAAAAATFLVLLYVGDFIYSAYGARKAKAHAHDLGLHMDSMQDVDLSVGKETEWKA